MNELIREKPGSNRSVSQSKLKGSAIQLTFHIPGGLQVHEEMVVEVRIIESSTPPESTGTIEVSPVQNDEIKTIPVEPEVKKVSFIKEAQVVAEDPINTIVPYFSLKLKNTPTVYKIGTSFLKDIEKGQKYFGFTSLSKQLNDLYLLVYASFINYSLKKPVLVVVRDFADISLDPYRSHFTDGTLWNWKTKDWGNLCFVDYKQIIKHSEELKNTDLDLITHEFKAVLWALPAGNVQTELQKSSLVVLDKINSISFVVSAGETKSKDIKKAAEYYQCFHIPVKGVLVEEGANECR